MYKRISIAVEVMYDDKGSIVPKKLFYKGRTYEIEKLIGTRTYTPYGIVCKDRVTG